MKCFFVVGVDRHDLFSLNEYNSVVDRNEKRRSASTRDVEFCSLYQSIENCGYFRHICNGSKLMEQQQRWQQFHSKFEAVRHRPWSEEVKLRRYGAASSADCKYMHVVNPIPI